MTKESYDLRSLWETLRLNPLVALSRELDQLCSALGEQLDARELKEQLTHTRGLLQTKVNEVEALTGKLSSAMATIEAERRTQAAEVASIRDTWQASMSLVSSDRDALAKQLATQSQELEQSRRGRSGLIKERDDAVTAMRVAEDQLTTEKKEREQQVQELLAQNSRLTSEIEGLRSLLAKGGAQ